jgi:hypothetical protein
VPFSLMVRLYMAEHPRMPLMLQAYAFHAECQESLDSVILG